ncbi:fibronectin type III domain-containing protein [Fulvivirga kasyanovii]|nr:fibronectin type III domain-containing protein [Fulvivirga kasyanovii]
MKNQKIRHKHSLTVALFMVAYMLLGIANPTFSQVYPVNATTQIAPPYSVFISDYVAPGSEQLKLNLFLRDLTEPVYDVRIRLVIEGQGVRIETSPAYNPPPVTIEGGLSTWLDAADLAPLFESRNLIFSGYSKSEFERYGRLPEGFYQFCFTVYDYQHPEIQLSQQSCQNLWLVRPDPPMLNQPACAAELKLNEMQQSVIFQWTPMAISPNSSFTTDYIFRLYEIRPEGRNPADIVLSSNPIYEIQTAETSLLYGVAEPPLIPGMEYVWQVQAIDLGGRDRFKNNGYSKVCTFKVAEDEVPLPEPSEFRAWGITENMGMASWTPSLEPDGYTVEYRLADNAQAEWFVEELQLPPDAQLADSMYVVLQDLMPQTQYEVRIGSKRGAFVSSWTETKRFTTYPPRVFACGDPQDLQQPLNTTPLISAIRGEVFAVGDFKMRLTKVTGGDGVFSGYGSIETPFLGFNIAVKFDNIRVNELYQVVAGEVVALSDGIDGLIENWEGEDDDDGTDTEDGSGGEDDGSEDDFDGEDITYDGEIGDVTVGDDGVITVTDENGTTHTYDQPVDPETGEKKDVRFTDSSGDIWIVDKNGNVSSGENSDNTGNSDNQQPLDVQEKLIVEVLEELSVEINNWLATNGKGPLSEEEIRMLLLSDYFSDKAFVLEGLVDEAIPTLMESPGKLKESINADPSDADKFQEIIGQITDKETAFKDQLSEDEWETSKKVIYDHLEESFWRDFFWEYPHWKKAAIIMEEYLDRQGYENTQSYHYQTFSEVKADLVFSQDFSTEMEWTFSDELSEKATFELLAFTYKVPYWEANQVTVESFKEYTINWLRLKDDRIARGEGWEVGFAEIVADIVTAPTGAPAIYGWVTGKHYRTKEELAGWEQALAVLDVIPAEALAKVAVTGLVVKIAGKVIDFAALSKATIGALNAAKAAGLKFAVKASNEIIVLAKNGKDYVFKIVKDVIVDIYWRYDVERVLAKLAGVKYIIDDSKNIFKGTLEIVEDAAGNVGIKSLDEFAEGLINGVRRYNIANDLSKGISEVTRTVVLGSKRMVLKWSVINGNIDFYSDAAKSNLRRQIKNFLGTSAGVDAHHVIPLGKTDHSVIQAAARDGFHPNLPESILGLEHYDEALEVGLHQNHPAYDKFIQKRLDDFQNDFAGYSFSEANEFVQKQLIPELKNEIFKAKNSIHKNLNDYFKFEINPRLGIN